MASQKGKKSFPPLSENEKKLLEMVNKGSVEEARLLLREEDVKVDCLDDSGMTPLQHAAFRGKLEVAQLLLIRGADVNSNHHENGYTALMFAALSGNPEVTRLMLQNGARKDSVNTVGRNAAQMAAFVGQHQCVAVINNYYDREGLQYYTVPRGQETEPKLPVVLLHPVLTLLNMANMHPVKVSLHLQENRVMMNESYKVCKVLDLICEKAMKARDTDDIMAMKAHYFATIIRKAKDDTSLDTWIKKLLKGRDSDGYPEFQDQVIRQALKEFPYVDSQLLQNMVRQLSTTKIGDQPTSLNILNQGINGHKFGFDETMECSTCGEQAAVKKCSVCKMVHYCNPDCQKLHWFTHKKFCKKLAEEYKKMEKLKEDAKKAEEQKQRQSEQQTNGETPNQNGETPNQNGETPNQTGETLNQTGDESKGAKPKTGTKAQVEQSSEGQAGSLDGYPEPAGMGGGADEAVPDIDKFLHDPEIIKAFEDPEVTKALEDIRENPANIVNYQENEKILGVIQTIPKKLKAFQSASVGAGQTGDSGKSEGATGGATKTGTAPS